MDLNARACNDTGCDITTQTKHADFYSHKNIFGMTYQRVPVSLAQNIVSA